MRLDRLSTTPPSWPPAWNPFEVFILALAIPSSYTLIHGSSGSLALDARLSESVVVLWGVCLAFGASLALAGVWCYRSRKHLVTGLWLESGGLLLVGLATSIYAFVVVKEALDIEGVIRAVATQAGFAAACFARALQGYLTLWRTRRLYLVLRAHDES